MNRNWLRWIGGISFILALCVVCTSAFIIWANQPQNVEDALARYTAEAATVTADVATSTVQAQIDEQRLAGKTLLFEETFAGPNFQLAELTAEEITDGAFSETFTYRGYRYYFSDQTIGDFVGEVDCTVFGEGMCGIIFSAQRNSAGDTTAYYAIYATGYGYGYSGVPLTGMSWAADWTHGAHNAGAMNRLKVVRLGKWAHIHLNDQFVYSLEVSDAGLEAGQIGLVVGRSTEDGVSSPTVTADNFKIYQLPNP